MSDRRIHILEVNTIHTVFVDILLVIRVTMLLEIEVSTVCCLYPVFLSHVLVLLLYKVIFIHHLGDSWSGRSIGSYTMGVVSPLSEIS